MSTSSVRQARDKRREQFSALTAALQGSVSEMGLGGIVLDNGEILVGPATSGGVSVDALQAAEERLAEKDIRLFRIMCAGDNAGALPLQDLLSPKGHAVLGADIVHHPVETAPWPGCEMAIVLELGPVVDEAGMSALGHGLMSELFWAAIKNDQGFCRSPFAELSPVLPKNLFELWADDLTATAGNTASRERHNIGTRLLSAWRSLADVEDSPAEELAWFGVDADVLKAAAAWEAKAAEAKAAMRAAERIFIKAHRALAFAINGPDGPRKQYFTDRRR